MTADLQQCRQNMVEQQVRPCDVLDERVLNTLKQIPREAYVPARYRNLAYADTAIPLNEREVMMHPTLEGQILQLLDIQPEDNVLEIGTGSGYLTACLANLACHVESYEIDPQLAELAKATLQAQGVFNIDILVGDGLQSTPVNKKYDVIVLTGSVSELPDYFLQALNRNSRLFMVDGNAPSMQAHIIQRSSEDDCSDRVVFETVLPRLVNGEKPAQFVF